MDDATPSHDCVWVDIIGCFALQNIRNSTLSLPCAKGKDAGGVGPPPDVSLCSTLPD